MHETPDDLRAMQDLLDRSYAHAGAHLASIHTPRTRLSATDLAARMEGMQIFVVATTNRDGQPRSGPVDAFLFRGQVRFGTAAQAMRARHLARDPAISATHVRGETLVVTVHGSARLLDVGGSDSDFRGFLRDHYGDEMFDAHLSGAPYYCIDATWMFAADMSVHTQAANDG